MRPLKRILNGDPLSVNGTAFEPKADSPSGGGPRPGVGRRIPVGGMLGSTASLGRLAYRVSLDTRPRRRGTKSRFPLAVLRTPPFAPFQILYWSQGTHRGQLSTRTT